MAEIKVGKADVKPDRVAHVRGVRRGGQRGVVKRDPGRHGDLSTARRSTGVNDKAKNPIMPGMPNLSPA